MQVVIKIEIGNDVMQTWEDVADAIRQPLNHSFGAVLDDDSFILHDANGNTVGEVKVAV